MKISIVTTLYNSASHLEEFYKRIILSVKKLTNDYEIVFVNDGSPDCSLEICKKLLSKNPRIKIIDLSRNFGHHEAMMTGIKHASGDYIFLIDADLEEAPESIVKFYTKLLDDDADVVYGVQKKRGGTFVNKIIGKIYYWTFKFLTGIQISPNICTVRLMSCRYAKALALYNEKALSIGGIWYLVGYKQTPLPIDKSRKKNTTYSFLRRLGCFVDSIVSFSFKPLVYFCFLGFGIFMGSIFYSSYVLIQKLIGNKPIDGWTSLIMSIWFLGGVTISFLGVISLYLAKIFVEVKSRPLTIIKEIVSADLPVNSPAHKTNNEEHFSEKV